MRVPKKKVYGQSKTERCPLCGDRALIKNPQGIPVCNDHKDFIIELVCSCGGPLEPKQGKWGVFFVCERCGPISWSKAMAMNDLG
ncbi:hypothetical protein JXA12_05255 [Candidatus Woesearchaeota archaeon]|nr:hypothetical protein [Candidatus Woesearchaeota archaeon]